MVPARASLPIDEALGEQGVLLALAATAYHAMPRRAPCAGTDRRPWRARPAARAAGDCAPGEPPVVWETQCRARAAARSATRVLDPDARHAPRLSRDLRRQRRLRHLLDTLIGRLAPGGEIVLAGFYSEPLSFAFPPAFMREARIRVAAEWQPADLVAVQRADRVRTAVARRPDHPSHGRARARRTPIAPRSTIPPA